MVDVATEVCFNVMVSAPLDPAEQDKLTWLLRETFEAEKCGAEPIGEVACTPIKGASSALRVHLSVPIGSGRPANSRRSPVWCSNLDRAR